MLTNIDKGLMEVVLEAHRVGFTVSSNFARERADYVGMAASMGYISTRVHRNVFSRDWRPTVQGLAWLNSMELTNEE
jgi:hypothetical protein